MRATGSLLDGWPAARAGTPLSSRRFPTGMTRAAAGWLGVAWLAFAVLPWYVLPGDGWLDPRWLGRYPDAATAPGLLQGAPPRSGLAASGRAPAPLALAGVATSEGRPPRRDGARPGGGRRPRVDRAPGASHRPPRLGGRVAGEPPRRAGTPAVRPRDGRPRSGPGVPHAPLSRPRRAGLHEGRCVPHEHDRPGRGARGRLRLLAGAHRARQRGARRGRRARALRLLRQAHGPLRLGPGLPPRAAPVRRGLEHAVPGGPGGGRHDDPRPRLRPDRYPDRRSRRSPSCGPCPCCRSSRPRS